MWRMATDGDLAVAMPDDGSPPCRIPLLVGGRYRVSGVIGGGGCGVVWQANDLLLDGQPVVLKARRYRTLPGLCAHPHDIHRAQQVARLRAETRFEAMCLAWVREQGEPRVPAILDVVVDRAPDLYGPHHDATGRTWHWQDPAVDGEPYLVLQEICGVPLREFLARLPSERHRLDALYEVAVQLARILRRLHQPLPGSDSYLIYQDLKPEQVLVHREQRLCLVDFGSVTLVTHGAEGPCSMVSDDRLGILGTPGAILGHPGLATPGYKPPEMGVPDGLRRLDRRCDVYAWGATLWSLIVGRPPPAEPEFGPLPVAELRHHPCYETLRAVVERALAPRREDRPRDMDEVLRCLGRS